MRIVAVPHHGDEAYDNEREKSYGVNVVGNADFGPKYGGEAVGEFVAKSVIETRG